jgi:hypothetical protein
MDQNHKLRLDFTYSMKNLIFLAAFALLIAACGSKTSEQGTADAANSATTKVDSNSTVQAKVIPSSRYKFGDTLYVYARSGLVLRDKPDVAGKKLATLEVTDPVIVTDQTPFKQSFQTKESCGLEINGFWVKVSHKGKEGYAFDGFLLKDYPKVEISMPDYWASRSKVIRSTDTPPKDDEAHFENYSELEFENGVKLTSYAHDLGTITHLTLPKSLFSFQTAYAWVLASIEDDPKNPIVWKYDHEKKEMLTGVSKDELQLYTVGIDSNENVFYSINFSD